MRKFVGICCYIGLSSIGLSSMGFRVYLGVRV